MKVWKIAVVITLAAGLVLAATLPGLAASDEEAAQPDSKPRPRWLKGVVSSINATEDMFTIKRGEETTDIRVNEGTRYFKVNIPPRRLLPLRQNGMALMQPEAVEATPPMQMKLKAVGQSLGRGKPFTNPVLRPVEGQELAPNLLPLGEDNEKPKRLQGYLKWLRRFGEEVTFDDLAVDDRVIVRVVPNEGEPLAKLVLIFKPSPYKRVIGEVTITNDIITITPEEGDAVHLIYNGDTRFILCGSPSLIENEEAVAIYVEEGDDNLAKRIMQGCSRPEVTDSSGS